MDLGFLRFDLMCSRFISFRSVVLFCFLLEFFFLDVDLVFVLLVNTLHVLDFDSEMVDY